MCARPHLRCMIGREHILSCSEHLVHIQTSHHSVRSIGRGIHICDPLMALTYSLRLLRGHEGDCVTAALGSLHLFYRSSNGSAIVFSVLFRSCALDVTDPPGCYSDHNPVPWSIRYLRSIIEWALSKSLPDPIEDPDHREVRML